MKLLMVASYYYPQIGGVETYVRALSIALRDLAGWDVVVVTSNDNGRHDRVTYVDGLKVYRLGAWGKLSNTPVSPTWPAKIRRIIHREQPDLILAHTPVPSMADAAALAAGRTPFILAYHASTLRKTGSLLFNYVARAYSIYERRTLSRADCILAVSDYVREQLPVGVRHKTKVLPNAVWKREIRSRQQPTGSNFLFVGSLGRPHAWKGLDLILEAVARYQRIHGDDINLRVLGDGSNRRHYEEKARGLGVTGAVRFCGWQTGEDKEAAFDWATAVVVYPTTANDAFPTVMLEAWARGVPVVAAQIGAIPSLIRDGTDGFLVPPHDPASLADALYAIATTESSARARLTAAAARRTGELYTWERQAHEFARLACELLSPHSAKKGTG